MSFHHRYFLILSSTGLLILLLLQGVCGVDDVTYMSAVVGGSVVLPSGYQRSEVETAEWNFKDMKIVSLKLEPKSQFSGRSEMNSSHLSLTVRKLTKADTGLFTFVCTNKKGDQLTTKNIQLEVYDSTLMVDIQKNVTLHQLNNTCTVSLLCNASGPPDVQFSWSGHCTGSGAKQHFSLSPAGGSVTCVCKASEGGNHKQVTADIKCENKTSNNSVEPDVINRVSFSETEWYLYFVVIPAAGVLIIVSITVGVCCYKRHKANSSRQETVYADVVADQNKYTERSTSTNVQFDMTIYESVDDRAIGIQNNPHTLYDKVNFSRPEMKKDLGATLSSPYQDVL
ncbi:signaling lymphocytic activation molecule-like [Sardina pilchardus]|uniref:signaling lymphocytic activation molecule-like n=1 Tax=Sardina pilchardus TaxID=27697 RepID=UPI002E0EA182